MIQEILDATTKRTKIKIDYVDREGERTTRIIRPYHVFKWHSNTYFMGFCEFDNDIRTFKISRLRKLEVLNNQFSDQILSLREYEALGHFSYFRHYPIRELKAAPQPRRQLDMPSTPYNVSSETIDFSQREPYRFTSDSTYPKEHYSPKSVNNPATCRSPIEEEIFTILDTDSKVRSYWIEAIRIPYIVGTEQHTYTPDILVEYTNGKKILVEIKASHDIDSVLNEMKFRAAELYCEEQGIRFQIWTLERGELKVFPSWQEAVSSERQVNVIDTYAMIRHPAKPPAYAPQEQEGIGGFFWIEPSPRKKLQIKRFIIAGCVLLLLVTSVILIIHYREGNQKSSVSSRNWLDEIHVNESVEIPSSDVELFDMRLKGTGGYEALSGRVKNNSVMEVKEIQLSITLYDLTGKPIDRGTAIISCSIPPFAVRSVTGDVTRMTPSEPLSWTWNYQILSVAGRKGQLESK